MVHPNEYAHSLCFVVFWCVLVLIGFPISFRVTSLALGQSYDCPNASEVTLKDMDDMDNCQTTTTIHNKALALYINLGIFFFFFF